MHRLKLGEAPQSLEEAVQGLGRGWGSTGKAGHDGRARAVMAGGGACFPRRTPVISGSGGALGAQVHMTKASGGTYRQGRGAGARGRATTRGALAAAASPRSAGQASDRTRGTFGLVIFKCQMARDLLVILPNPYTRFLLCRLLFVSLTSLEWIRSWICEIRGGEDGFVARLKTETKVESKRVKWFLFDFKLCQSMFKVIWHHFQIWVL
jgi:hypothetical protein